MTNQTKVRTLEVVSVLVIVASVAMMAIPKTGELARRDIAARVTADVEVVRAAVYAFYSDSAYFPEKVGAETLPENLALYLPGGFSFTRPYGTLEYRNWPVRPAELGSEASNMVGVTVTLRDPRIAAAVMRTAPRSAKFVLGNKYTLLFFGS